MSFVNTGAGNVAFLPVYVSLCYPQLLIFYLISGRTFPCIGQFAITIPGLIPQEIYNQIFIITLLYQEYSLLCMNTLYAIGVPGNCRKVNNRTT